MSYMGSTAIRGKNVVGGRRASRYPDRMRRASPEISSSSGLVQIGEQPCSVPAAYGEGPEVMDRRK